MTRGTRAYLRLDPGFDEHKEGYPDGPYAALIAVFCLAESQPERGYFRNDRFLRALMGKRGRHLPYLMEHGDLVERTDGRLYVDGWEEWQEGNWKVQERLERLRERRERNGLRRNGSGPRATPGATDGATDDRLSGAGRGGAVAVPGGSGSGAGQVAPAPDAPNWFTGAADDGPEWPVLQWLASHGATQEPNGKGFHPKLCGMVERHGATVVIEALDRAQAAGNRTTRQLVFALDDLLDPPIAMPRAPAETPEMRQVREMQERREIRRRAGGTGATT